MPKDNEINALRLSQWLEDWNNYNFDPDNQRRRPEKFIYLFSMSAAKLLNYSDVYRRERNVDQAEGIQRAREDRRTNRIGRYIKFGYPYGDLRESNRKDNEHLCKPGWLPTAIVINLLTEQDVRKGNKIKKQHMAYIDESDGKYTIRLPEKNSFENGDLRPIEVIDGQHRLWAFEENPKLSEFELPVVAFQGLDVSWQAYLFWSINISPVRINPSHAFDLYPLLRTQDWLEKTGEINVYREARAQEITEWLYQHSDSPWHNRISMLQRKGEPKVSQAAWVRSLIKSFFGTGRGKGRQGLFHSALIGSKTALNWERIQQIAFILTFWNLLKKSVDEGQEDWIKLYHKEKKDSFADQSSMLNQDMGIRAVHAVLNDLFFFRANEWKLEEWTLGGMYNPSTTYEDINVAVTSLQKSHIHQNLASTAKSMSSFDWRSLKGPGVRLSEVEMTKRAYRGDGGYTLLTQNLLKHVSKYGDDSISEVAIEILTSAIQ